jgi:signal transduction histidine kinase
MNKQKTEKKAFWKEALFLTLLIAVVAGGAVAAFFFSYQSINDLLWAERADTLTSVISRVSKTTEMYFGNYWDDLDHDTSRLSDQSSPSESDLCALTKTIEKEQKLQEGSLLLFFDSGRYVTSDEVSHPFANLSTYTQNHDRSMAVVDLTGVGGSGTDSILFFSKFTTPLKINNESLIYLATTIPSSELDAFFTTIRYNEQSLFYVMDENGLRVYHSTNALSSAIDAPNLLNSLSEDSFYYGTSYGQLSSNIASKKDGTAHLDIKGTRYLLSYSSLGVNDWTILMSVPSETASVGTEEFTRRVLVSFTLITSLIMVLITIAVSLVVHNNHTKKIEAERALRLKEEADAERQTSAAKTAFLSNMSHDIRTPLNGISGMLDIAQEHLDDPKAVEGCLETMKLCSDHLIALVNDVLDMSRIESGKVVIKQEPFNLLSVLDMCSSIIKSELEGRDVAFTYDFSKLQHPNVIGDSVRLQRIIINILGNSVKFTPDGKSISFRVEETPLDEKSSSYHLIMEDTGVGMSEEFQKRIFDSFTQEERAQTSTYKGTGLGMAITKQYVSMMKGTILLKSKVNEGTRFDVILPLSFTTEPVLDEKTQAAMTPIPSLEGKKVMLVEDNEINIKIALHLLAATKADVVVEKNGRLAYEEF